MNYNQIVFLDSANQTLSGFAPFTLSIIPSSVSVSNKVYNIEYILDEETTINQRLTIDEGGDPLYIPQIHTYYLTDTIFKKINIVVNVYTMGSSEPQKFNIDLNLLAPEMETNIFDQTESGVLSGFFQEMHLMGTRMFGPNNDILYMFESINKDQTIPALVNWDARPIIPPPPKTVISKYRPYKLLNPFENERLTSINTGTNIDSLAYEGPYDNPDNGSPSISLE